MASFPETVGGWLLDLVGFVGLALGGGQAAASGVLQEMQQDSLEHAANGASFFTVPARGTVNSPAALAEMVVKGVLPFDDAQREAKFSGMQTGRFDDLVKSTGNPPGFQSLVDMWRRQIITAHDVEVGIKQGYIKPEWIPYLVQLHDELLPVSELVTAAVQNHMDYLAAENVAFQHGVRPQDFTVMYENAGNPPGPQEMLDLWNRGDVDEQTVDQALKESRLKNKYIDSVKKLHRRIFTVGEAVTAAVQGHLDIGAAAAAAARQGVERSDFDVLYETAGNPPGPMEVLDLWRRGDIDEATVDQALRESRLKNKYIDVLKKRARRLVPMRTITTLLHGGAVTDAHAVEMLQQLGFNQPDAQAIVNASHFEKVAPDKTLTLTQIRDLYTSHMISKEQAVADLALLHYPAAVAGQVLDLADREISRRDRTATITKIRNAYLSRRIDRANASGDLDTIGVEAGQRDALLNLWDIELDNNVALLTVAEICRAGKLGLIPPDEVLARLSAHGYSDADTILVAQVHAGIPLPSTTT